MGWRKACYFSCVVALAISGDALKLDGDQTDSCTLKGGLDNATTWANWQQGGCKMLWLIELVAYSVMNTAAHSGFFPTAHYDRLFSRSTCHYHSSYQYGLRLHRKIAELNATGHGLTMFMFVLVHHPDNSDSTADNQVASSAPRSPKAPVPLQPPLPASTTSTLKTCC